MKILTELAAHNEWANRRLFSACSQIDFAKLSAETYGYDSVIGILNHFVQVENSFFELAHGRQPQWVYLEQLEQLRLECARIDGGYRAYADALDEKKAETESFLVPWFGFEINRLEGVLQPLTHSHKHRADVSMLLPLLGGTGIEMDFILWLEEQRER
jgi:uncharacterized damage-inducible protein DinB